MDRVKEYYQRWCDTPQPRKIRAIKLVMFFCYSFFLLFLVIYAFGRTGKKTVTIVPTVLFTDGTPYNLQVIRYLTQRRDVVLAMIVVNSNSLAVGLLRSNVGNVAAMLTDLQAEGYSKTVPVYESQTSTTDSFAAPLDDLLAKQSVKFVIAGPCTEAAYFLAEYPARRAKVANIYVGGGAFNKDGNANYFVITNTKAERNFYMDATAANYIVSGSHERPVTVLPLDAAMTWTDSAYAAIVTAPGSSAASVETVAQGLLWYYTNVDGAHSTTVGILAAAYASDMQVYQSAAATVIPVQVITAQTNVTNGRSYRPSSGTSTVTVITSLGSSTFFPRLVAVNLLALV